jgi:enamine deaminase RidA (YjgF/YER057c/UK114 family)
MKIATNILACLVITMLSTAAANAAETAEITTLAPDSLPQPFKNRFSHGKLIPAGAEWLFTAGQTGVNGEGVIGKDIQQQADWAMKNLYEIVREGGMDSADVVKMTIYYLDPADLPIIVAARNRYFGEDFRPASTAVGVSALARPGFLVEVELVAARMPATTD